MKKGLLAFAIFCLMLGASAYIVAGESDSKEKFSTHSNTDTGSDVQTHSTRKPCCGPKGTISIPS